MRVKLLIFDMDGVIADTEPYHQRARRELMDRLGIEEMPPLAEIVGRSIPEIWRRILGEGVRNAPTPAQLELMQYDLILKYMRDNGEAATPGLLPLMDKLAGQGIPMALCSSSTRYFVDRLLEYLQLSERFSLSVAGDEVPRRKPAPDCYRKVLELMNVTAGEAVAIEDSAPGIRAACAAGIPCIGFISPGSVGQDLGEATKTVDAMSRVPPLLLEGFAP